MKILERVALAIFVACVVFVLVVFIVAIMAVWQ